MKRLKQILPIWAWFSDPNYTRRSLRTDLVAGITTGVLLIPQCMAYSLIIGIPPIYGLYAATFPLLVYVLLGTSRQLSIGPTALGALLTAAAVVPLAKGNEETLIALAITMSLLAGIVRALMGVLKLGFVANFLSKPILSGFTSAAAIIIASSQIKHLLGVKTPGDAGIIEVWRFTLSHLQDVHLPSLLVGLGGIGLMFLATFLKKKTPVKIPGALLTVGLGLLVSWLFGLSDYGVKIVEDIPSGLPPFVLPKFDLEVWKLLLPGAFTIAVLGFIESISIAKWVEQELQDHRVSANKDLVAIGLANVVAAFFQGFPISGSFSRTAVVNQLEAKSPLYSLFATAFILFTLLFLTKVFYHLPNAILAAIIISAIIRLIDFKLPADLWKKDRKDFFTLVATFCATLFIGIEAGVLTGLGLALLMVVYEMAQPHYAILGQLPGSSAYRNIKRFPQVVQRPDALIIRFDGRLFFGDAENFREVMIRHIQEKGSDLKLLLIAAQGMHALDYTGVQSLRDVHNACTERGVSMYISGILGPTRDTFARHQLFKEFGQESFFLNVAEAIQVFDERQSGIDRSGSPAARQHH
ncbi:MAG: SulP family inorganic anion transporter [Bacteroidia bacterium]